MFDIPEVFLPLQEFTYFENAFRIPVTPLTHKKASAVHHGRSGVSANDDGWRKHPGQTIEARYKVLAVLETNV